MDLFKIKCKVKQGHLSGFWLTIWLHVNQASGSQQPVLYAAEEADSQWHMVIDVWLEIISLTSWGARGGEFSRVVILLVQFSQWSLCDCFSLDQKPMVDVTVEILLGHVNPAPSTWSKHLLSCRAAKLLWNQRSCPRASCSVKTQTTGSQTGGSFKLAPGSTCLKRSLDD